MTLIPFIFASEAWTLMLYDTRDERTGEETYRAAAYVDSDPAPRGPRRTWTVSRDGTLAPWGCRYEGDWPELDASVAPIVKDWVAP